MNEENVHITRLVYKIICNIYICVFVHIQFIHVCGVKHENRFWQSASRVSKAERSEYNTCVFMHVCDLLNVWCYLKDREMFGALSTENNIPLLSLFLRSFFSLPVLPSSALLISLRYGSQWLLLSLLCPVQSSPLL